MGIMALCRLFNPGPVLQKGAKEKHLAEMEKKVALMLAANGAPNQRLARARRPEKQQALGRRARALRSIHPGLLSPTQTPLHSRDVFWRGPQAACSSPCSRGRMRSGSTGPTFAPWAASVQ